MQAILALEDGRIFRGEGYGHPGECQGEVVFNTSLTGYQEIATDPSYAESADRQLRDQPR
jgi:carbamoyl-phosphate synthase small subunit